ncbi:MAG: hypothetical protein U0W40_08330 [Acidimicrobiia bacterium]
MFTDTDLTDPTPPVPGASERAKVATRAKQIKRNRRLTAAGGALGVVAVVTLGVAGLSGGSSGSGTSRIEVAGTAVERETTTTQAPVATTVAPTPTADTTPAPAVADNQAPAADVQQAPAPVATFTVSGALTGYPSGVTGSVRLVGEGGTFFGTINSAGSFSISGVPAGTYDASYSWQTTPDGAMQVGRATVTVTGDVNVSIG